MSADAAPCDAGYARAIGVELRSLEPEQACLHLPYSDANSNPGRALHGGCAASLAAIGAQLVAQRALEAPAASLRCAALHVSYLAAAIGEDVDACARLLRRGKELCFVEVDVTRAGDGKAIAHASAMLHARTGTAPAPAPHSHGDDAPGDPGFLGPHVARMPYMAARGIEVEHMADGSSRIALPRTAANAAAGGGVHDGALLAALDTAGAMAAWSDAGRGPHKASTPALQARLLATAPDEDLLARGRVVHRDGTLYTVEVEASGRRSRDVVALATVLYRIVRGD